MSDLIARLRAIEASNCEGYRGHYMAGRIGDAIDEIGRLRAALESIAGFGQVNLSGEWEHGLRDIIRSMTDCARAALNSD